MSESLDPVAEVPELSAEEIQSRVLHRDGLMLVIDKPAGLPVHRGPKGGANLESSFDALRFGLPPPSVLPPRLDRDQAGCLVPGRQRHSICSNGSRPAGGAGIKPHTVNRAPSCPVIVSRRTLPGVSPAIATGIKCSVRPCVALSIRTCRVTPTSNASLRCSAASAV